MAGTRLENAPMFADVADTRPAEAELLGNNSAAPSRQASGPSASARLEELLQTDTSTRVQELSDSEEYTDEDESDEEEDTMADPSTTTNIPVRPRERVTPSLFTTLPPIKDDLETQTSHKQDETVEQILPWHIERHPDLELNRYDVPQLQKEKHVKFLRQWLRKFPAHFVAVDASRPWMMYWSLAGMGAVGHDIESDHEGYAERLTSTVSALQNCTGGIGGGGGHFSHLAATYAALLALTTCIPTSTSTTSQQHSLSFIDRTAMHRFLCAMKQPNGGFSMTYSGEVDIRGSYCALTIITLLDLPLSLTPDCTAYTAGLRSLADGLAEWISTCQTYEGGLGAAPGNEAHGAYAFCGLAALCILGAPHTMIPNYLDMESLIAWLSSRQYAPEGGFSGRTNKLVDGCYSHWVGGCWALVEAAVPPPSAAGSSSPSSKGAGRPVVGEGLWNRAALGRYVLSVAQQPKGGLRDKPSTRPDAYHTCYNLAGLSAAQYRYRYTSPPREDEMREGGIVSDGNAEKGNDLTAAYNWTYEHKAVDSEGAATWEERDLVHPMHPVFVIAWGNAEAARRWSEGQSL